MCSMCSWAHGPQHIYSDEYCQAETATGTHYIWVRGQLTCSCMKRNVLTLFLCLTKASLARHCFACFLVRLVWCTGSLYIHFLWAACFHIFFPISHQMDGFHLLQFDKFPVGGVTRLYSSVPHPGSASLGNSLSTIIFLYMIFLLPFSCDSSGFKKNECSKSVFYRMGCNFNVSS